MSTRSFLRPVLLMVVGVGSASATDGDDTPAWLEKNLSPLLTLYRHLHAHPELSYHEVDTAKRIAAEWREAGFTVTEGVGKTGVVGLLKNGDGPTVLLRTDLDALPIAEQTGLPYASRATAHDDDGNEVGVMHACGHDVHMTVLVGIAQLLAASKDRWRGTVVLVGQPAEEKVGGARAMLADGLYRRFPKPDFALALHVTNDIETGKVSWVSGPMMASSTSVDVTIRGKGGHGAAPQETVDPIALAALFVLDLQTIVSREMRPIDPVVITVGSIHGGTKHNIIPDEVKLQLTLRAYREDVRQRLIEGIRRRVDALATAHRAPAGTVTLRESTPPTINTPALVERVLPALQAALGEANVVAAEPRMGAEDFGLFSQDDVPIFMFWLGAVPPQAMAAAKERGEGVPGPHSPRFAPDPSPTISTGVRAMAAAVTELLPAK
jgi:hippurate hydrolase